MSPSSKQSNSYGQPFLPNFGREMKIITCSPHNVGKKCMISLEKFKGKMKNYGKQCLWVGYTVRHAVGTFCLINSTTKRCKLSRDVFFLKKAHCEWAHVKEPLMLPMTKSVDNDEEEISSPWRILT